MAAEAAVRGPEAPLEPEPEPEPEPELGPGPSEAELELEGEELVLDEVDVHIQANLEDALVQEALKTGVDLREYSKQVELELQEVERASIRDYIKESENIASLHNQITACDAILERMEQMLGAFQCDLSSISCEIRALQEHSVAMTLRLRNRRAVRRQLGRLLDQLVVPPAMISAILEAPVTEPQFLEQLQELNGKIDSVKEQAFRDTVACADVQHVLEKLKIKAVTKIREFVLQKIYSFRKPMTNYQIPQNALLKYRFFYQFLLANERAVAQELREQYVDTNRNTVFTLGNRGGVIAAAELEAPIIVPHAAQRSDLRFPFESLFRSQHYALLDTGCREFAFLCDFFMVIGPSALQLFDAVMGKTLAMVLKHVDAYVCDCYDGIAVFLCIHIVLRFRALITRRYAEFSSAIVSINQTFPNEKTNALLGQLQVEVENFVLRVAAEFSSRKEQLIFLINNYDMMLGVLMERAVEESKEVEGFQQLLSARTQEFIEELLSPPFGGMIAFVKEAEALLEKGQLERLRGEEARVTQLARGFSSTWKASVESLSQDVMRSFSNFKNGTSIIQGALTQLIQYYHRFHKVLAQPPLRALPVRADLINIHHLMVELKKHKPNF
ncbi:hypothetical protein Q9966_014706 [Columba livia]|nr:hypothetical protein Q9966_014706 [Columba livia]